MTTTLEDERPTVRPRRRFAFLLRPGWISAIVGALAFTAACWLILAPWQFSRNSETSAANHEIDSALTAAPVPVRHYLSTGAEPEQSATWQPVTATGVFDPSHTFYVRLRQDDGGNPVSEVVLPMRLDDGTVLLVDRGDRSIYDIGTTPLPPVPTDRVTVTGRVQQDQTDPAHRGPVLVADKFVGNRIEVHAVNADALAAQDGTVASGAVSGNILQGYIQLVASSPGVLTEIGMPQTDDGPYLSYALQWCAFGAMSLLAIAYFIFREATDPRGPDERNVAYPERTRYPDEVGFAPDRPAPPEPVAASAIAAVPAPPPGERADRTDKRKPKRKRASRDGFDRSQLID